MSFSIENLGEKSGPFFKKYGTWIILGGGALVIFWFFFGNNSGATDTDANNVDTDTTTEWNTDVILSSIQNILASNQNATEEILNENNADLLDQMKDSDTKLSDQMTGFEKDVLSQMLKQNEFMTDTAKTQKSAIEKLISNTSSGSSSSTKKTSSKKTYKYGGKTSSLVSALNNWGWDSSYSYRKKLAKANGISNYKGTASQNTKLLNKWKSGKLYKA